MKYFKDILTLLNSINAKQDDILMILKNHKKKDDYLLNSNDTTVKKNSMCINNTDIVKVIFPVGASEYSELLESVGLPIDKIEHQFGNDTICVKFVETEVMDFDKKSFVSVYGKGKTYEEACEDYCKQIAGKTLHSLESGYNKVGIWQIPLSFGEDINVISINHNNSSNIRTYKYYSKKLSSFGYHIVKYIDNNCNIAVCFGDAVFHDGEKPIGRGQTYEEACKDYCKHIAGKTLVINRGKCFDIPKDLYQKDYDSDESNKYVKILESAGFKIDVQFRDLDKRLMVSYEHAEVSNGVSLTGEYGVGQTYEEACKDYCKHIAGKTLVFNAMRKDRFSYKVPEIFYNN